MPGDLVVLKQGVVFCDMALVRVDHIVVDEAALTGESTPVTKIEFDATMSSVEYDLNRHKKYTLFAGSKVVELGDGNEDCLGLVLTTGAFTTKGKLLCDVLSYQRHQFLFDHEIKIVLLILLIQAVSLMLFIFHSLEDQFAFAFFYGVFILAAVLPPLLPTVFLVAVSISANRLRKRRIACVNPEGILVAGKVNLCCFDKTGTITEAGMSLSRVECGENEELQYLSSLGFSVCHSIKLSSSGEYIGGNQVDKASFRASHGVMDYENGTKNVVIRHRDQMLTVLKHFDFDHHLQTQSVIIENKNSASKKVFVKGSPEAIRSRCNPESIPLSFTENLHRFSKSGFYQLALAYKEYDSENEDLSAVTREEVETSLTFVGFALFQNVMKLESPGVMRKLKRGNVLRTMITGDSVLTGISIARESGMCENQIMYLGQLGTSDAIEWIDLLIVWK